MGDHLLAVLFNTTHGAPGPGSFLQLQTPGKGRLGQTSWWGTGQVSSSPRSFCTRKLKSKILVKRKQQASVLALFLWDSRLLLSLTTPEQRLCKDPKAGAGQSGSSRTPAPSSGVLVIASSAALESHRGKGTTWRGAIPFGERGVPGVSGCRRVLRRASVEGVSSPQQVPDPLHWEGFLNSIPIRSPCHCSDPEPALLVEE